MGWSRKRNGQVSTTLPLPSASPRSRTVFPQVLNPAGVTQTGCRLRNPLTQASQGEKRKREVGGPGMWLWAPRPPLTSRPAVGEAAELVDAGSAPVAAALCRQRAPRCRRSVRRRGTSSDPSRGLRGIGPLWLLPALPTPGPDASHSRLPAPFRASYRPSSVLVSSTRLGSGCGSGPGIP